MDNSPFKKLQHDQHFPEIANG